VYKGKKIGVVVPAHNEEPFIAEVIETMPPFVDRIYVTNDASTDSTGDILNDVASDKLVITNHRRRMGAGAAMVSGYKKACSDEMDVIAIMAGDGQMDPAILSMILDPVVDGEAAYSKGDRLSLPEHKDGMPTWRAFGNLLLTYLTRMSSGYWNVSDPQNGYTAISRGILERVDLSRVETGFAFENDLLVKLHACGARVINVPHPARYRGEHSKIRYLHFMMSTSRLLLKDFLWRFWVEHMRPGSGKTV
jgi:glycosyltransferase involved in cell wall biosynthesis